MIISEFIEMYKDTDDEDIRVGLCKECLKRTYAPIVEKTFLIKRFIDSCVMKSDNGVLYIDMVCNKMNFTSIIITLYTDLQLGNPEGENAGRDVIKVYDAFQEYGIIDVFCKLIGEREINELRLINEEALKTWHEEHTSTRSYLTALTDKAVRTFVEVTEILSKQNIDPNILSKTVEGDEKTE